MADSTDYNKWIDRANQDIKMIHIIKNDGFGGLEDSFCYMCQQATEKLFKALLVKKEKRAPKTHDLIYLLGKCRKHYGTLSDLEDKITVLNEYAVSARYPDDYGDKRTIGDAEEAFEYVNDINTLIKSIFNEGQG